jgi:acetyl-CoA carboxylase biotin carboxyl carrier protein
MPLNDDDVREILRIIDESELDELSIETEGFSLHVRKGSAAVEGSGPADAPAADVLPRTPAAGAPTTPSSPASSTEGEGLDTIASPMLGTFYRSEAPGAAPFVEVGAQVGPETTVCIIEVMKMMNSVPAGVSGTIAEICTQNGHLVEYGEPLFRVTPDR